MGILCFRPFISAPGRLLWRGLAILSVLSALAASLPSGPKLAGLTSPSIAPDFGKLPLSFVPNVGQTDPAVRFQAHSMGSTLFFTPNEVVLSLMTNDQRRRINDQSPETLHLRPSFVLGRSSVMHLRFEGANPTPEMVGADRLPGAVNYFIGDDPSRWRTNLPTYGGIIYQELYPGIDLHYEGRIGTAGQASLLKGTYTVAPGADPTRIRWHYAGAASVRLDPTTGNLLIELPSSNIIPNSQSQLIERAPIAWQSINGRRVPVSVRYAVAADGGTGFVLGHYDPAYPLTLDPALTYSTYLGGSGYDYGYDIALDADGNAYVIGYTNSVDFPTKNPAQPDFGGGMGAGDAFVVKLNPTGSTLVYATYLGGGGNDRGFGIALDADGNAYVTGDTTSIDFPTQNPIQPETGGGGPFEGDAFVAKLDATGSALVYATYLGGIGDEIGYDIALDADSNAYVAGYTSSTDFPIANAVQPDPAFPQGLDVLGDAFVTTIISASEVYTWGHSTYLGGTDWDEAHGIAVDALGNAYVTGNTRSIDFPTMKPVQPDFGGGSFNRGDAFVTQIISASEVYTWGYSTYLGGTGSDTGYGIALDGSNDAYVLGETASTNFPTANPLQAANAGDRDAFVTKVISASGVYTWGYSTYLGGDGDDIGSDIAVDTDGNAYLTGYAFSANFPTTDGAYDTSCGTDGLCDGTGGDAFFTKLNAPGDVLAYSTYLGGGSTDFGHGIALDDSGDAYLAGFTYSADFPVTTAAYDTDCGTDGQCNGFVTDAFVAKIGTGELYAVYLPILLKGSGEPPPPPGCAPYLVDTINVGDTPRGIAIDTTRNRVYVANYGSSSLSVIDSSNMVIQTITGITSANGVAYDPTQNVIWVTNYSSDQVTPVDAASFAVLPPVTVGDGPWGVAYDPVHNYIYVVNSLDNSVTVVDAKTRLVVATPNESFSQPFHVAANPDTGKVYVANFGNHSVTVVNGISISSTVDLGADNPSTQPYGVAVDETRDLVYVATVDSHRVVVIGTDGEGTPDQLLGWAAFRRGFGDPARPVPMRAIAVNPDIGPTGDGGHLWSTTSSADGSEADQVLLIPKGWGGRFSWPTPYDMGTNPSEGIAVDRVRDWVYVTGGTTPGTVTVLGDSPDTCMVPFSADDGIGFEVFNVQE